MTELSTNHQFEGKSLLGGDYQSKNLQAVFAAFEILKNVFEISQRRILLMVSEML